MSISSTEKRCGFLLNYWEIWKIHFNAINLMLQMVLVLHPLLGVKVNQD